MNPFLNPINALPILKNYITDPNRIDRLDKNQMNKYKDKVFKKIFRYAYSIPLYHNKYKKHNIYPNGIKGLKDISKLPFITKKDFIDNYPDGLLPKNYNKKYSNIVTTSGSTGKPVSFYIDFMTLAKSLSFFFRLGKIYNFNWRKVKVASIGNFSKGKADQVFDETIMSKSSFLYNKNNKLWLNAFDEMKDIVNKLNKFKPDYIVSYPITFQQLAYFKKKGYADNVNPKILVASGYVLDEYTRDYVQNAFNCKLLNTYTSAESYGDISFECFDYTWHINHDFYHLEAVDPDNKLVSPGEKGHVVFTRLFGKATPFIRYLGMDDWVTLLPDDKCSCGLETPIIKNGVEGRQSTSIVLPNGKIFPSASFAIVSLILKDLKTYKVTQFQIIQHKIDKIDINLVIDEDLRNKGPSVELIFDKIKKAYEEKVGPDVTITVKEVKRIKSPPGKPLPLVISKIKPEEGFRKTEETSFKNK